MFMNVIDVVIVQSIGNTVCHYGRENKAIWIELTVFKM